MTDDHNLRPILGHLLRDGVSYQDGRSTDAPVLVFADADYEDGDGICGLHADCKTANEPPIVYVRADGMMHVIAERDALCERIDLIRNELQLLGYELSEAGLRRGDAAYDRGSKIFKLIDEMNRAARQDARRKEDK